MDGWMDGWKEGQTDTDRQTDTQQTMSFHLRKVKTRASNSSATGHQRCSDKSYIPLKKKVLNP